MGDPQEISNVPTLCLTGDESCWSQRGRSETGDGRTGRTRVVAERGTSWRGRFWILETQTLLIFKTRRRLKVAEH